MTKQPLISFIKWICIIFDYPIVSQTFFQTDKDFELGKDFEAQDRWKDLSKPFNGPFLLKSG